MLPSLSVSARRFSISDSKSLSLTVVNPSSTKKWMLFYKSESCNYGESDKAWTLSNGGLWSHNSKDTLQIQVSLK